MPLESSSLLLANCGVHVTQTNFDVRFALALSQTGNPERSRKTWASREIEPQQLAMQTRHFPAAESGGRQPQASKHSTKRRSAKVSHSTPPHRRKHTNARIAGVATAKETGPRDKASRR